MFAVVSVMCRIDIMAPGCLEFGGGRQVVWARFVMHIHVTCQEYDQLLASCCVIRQRSVGKAASFLQCQWQLLPAVT